MTLDDYLRDKSVKEFAEKLGVNEATIWRWRHKKRLPSKAMIIKIQEITSDAVRPGDFYD